MDVSDKISNIYIIYILCQKIMFFLMQNMFIIHMIFLLFMRDSSLVAQQWGIDHLSPLDTREDDHLRVESSKV